MDKIIKIIALFGKSGAGKDTIRQWIVSNMPNMQNIISYTTRPKRDRNEENGKTYYFISDAEFALKEVQGLMIETTEFRNWHYGTSIESLSFEKTNVGVFNIQSIELLLADARLSVLPIQIIAPAGARLKRVVERELNPNYDEIYRRIFADERDFKNIPFEYLTFSNASDINESTKIMSQNLAIYNFITGQY